MNISNKKTKTPHKYLMLLTASLMLTLGGMTSVQATPTEYKTIDVQSQNIFYREAGDKSAPTIVLLHGFPTSSHMYRNLIPKLAETYHVIAPDYPGFGNSSMPAVNEFEYSFDNLANITDTFLQKEKMTGDRGRRQNSVI